MKQLFILFLLITSISITNAQDSTKIIDTKIKLEVHGFLKTDYWWDSRQVVYAREGLFTLFPENVKLDKYGNDINAQGSFNFSAITSRVGIKIIGFEAFGAKTFGYLEADFSGMSNVTINAFRLRHSYIQLDWKKSSLLLGQYWHPLFVADVFPTVISLNTGSPFQPFNRSTQIRFTQNFNKLKLMATALDQRDYSSNGPIGKSFTYLSNSLIPNFNFLLQYNDKNTSFGIAYDIKSLKPRLETDSNIIAKGKIVSNSVMAYFKWLNNTFEFKTKAIYGENLTDNLLLGGYAIASIDTSTDARDYTTTKHAFIWMDFIYHKKFKAFSINPGLFIGYSKNLGTKEENIGIFYSTGSNINDLYRIAPSISLKSGNFMISLELERTTASYGSIDKKGLVSPINDVTNNRLLVTGFYFF